MAGPYDDEEQEKPLDPAVERVRRKLVRFVIINLGILFLALMAVVAAIVYRASRSDAPPPVATPELPFPAEGEILRGEIALPAGSRIAGHSLSGSQLTLEVELEGGRRAFFIYDTAAGRMVGRFDVVPGAGAN